MKTAAAGESIPVLAVDIGGTKTRVALVAARPGHADLLREQDYPSHRFESLTEILGDFLQSGDRPVRAGFGVAGPVRGGRCQTTNLPWMVDATDLARELQLPGVNLLNDLEATAWGIGALGADDMAVLNPGEPDPEGNLAVIAAGTGLGEAGVCRTPAGLHPFATEGGHADFAPENELEFALYQFLSRRYGHVSWERVASGMALPDVFRFICDYAGKPVPEELIEALNGPHAGGAISEAAAKGACPLCAQTMELFVTLYGREAGNHALKMLATGGVYLGGGIAPKILLQLKSPGFLNAFFAKGRMEPLMRNMPVQVILNDRAALYGAAMAAVTEPPAAG